MKPEYTELYQTWLDLIPGEVKQIYKAICVQYTNQVGRGKFPLPFSSGKRKISKMPGTQTHEASWPKLYRFTPPWGDIHNSQFCPSLCKGFLGSCLYRVCIQMLKCTWEECNEGWVSTLHPGLEMDTKWTTKHTHFPVNQAVLWFIWGHLGGTCLPTMKPNSKLVSVLAIYTLHFGMCRPWHHSMNSPNNTGVDLGETDRLYGQAANLTNSKPMLW